MQRDAPRLSSPSSASCLTCACAASLRGCTSSPELAGDVEEQAVVDAARAQGIALEGVCAYRVLTAPPPAMLTLGYANVSEPAIARAIATLAEAIAGVRTR